MDGLKSLTGLLMNTFVMPVLNFFDGSVSVGGLIGNHSVSHILSKSNSTQERVLVEITPEDVDIFLKTKAILHTLFNILALAAVCGCLYALYHFFFTPLDRVRKLGSIGYLNHHPGPASKKELANLLRKRRKIGENLPPVYPNGWFRLFDSLQVKAGQVKEISALGLGTLFGGINPPKPLPGDGTAYHCLKQFCESQHFAVFRTKSGKVHVLDAYCPHMGGNLAIGGRVKGDCLECPFHGWVFNGEGNCVSIPYAEKIPTFAKTKSWPSREVNGVIYVWYHCDGLEPSWELTEITEITNGLYHYRGRVEHHANTHIQDIPENGSDLAHLSHLHVPSVFSGADLSTQFDSKLNVADHIFKAVSRGSEKETPHIRVFDLTHELVWKNWTFFPLRLKVYQIGPGIVHLHFDCALGKGVLVQSLTPVEPLHQVLTHNLYATWKFPTCIGRIFLMMEAIQVDRDVMIWNNKTFACQPKLVKEDSLITKYRRWFAQFYTPNSPRLQMQAADDMSW